jgi:manganese transport protein
MEDFLEATRGIRPGDRGMVEQVLRVLMGKEAPRGLSEIGTLEEAYRTLHPLFGPVAGGAFALALLASGLSSSTVGTMSGQIIMQGFLRRRIPVGVRRLVTMLPSLVVIGLGWDPTRTLVISQVVLSFGLPFAVFPLIFFTARRDLMGDLANRPLTTLLALGMGTLVVGLNGYLLYALIRG